MKRFVLLFAVTVCTALLFVFSADAAGAALIEVNNAEVSAGETVVVPVEISNNPGILSLYLDVRYDSALSLLEVRDTGLFSGGLFSENIASYPLKLSWDSSEKKSENTADGIIAELVFKAKKDIPEGEYPVTVSFDEEQVYDNALEKIPLKINNGKVSVVEEKTVIDSGKVKLSGKYLFLAPDATVNEVKGSFSREIEIKAADGTDFADELMKSGLVISDKNGMSYLCVLIGDTDGDGDIASSDARITLRNAVGLEKFSSWQNAAGDTDFSWNIDSSDARNILRASVGLEEPQVWFNNAGYERLVYEDQNSFAPTAYNDDYAAAGEYIVSRLRSFETEVDLTDFNITKGNETALLREYVFEVPSLFYVEHTVYVKHFDEKTIGLRFVLTENAKEKYEEYRELISAQVQLADESLSDLEKILFYHDHICKSFSYDTSQKIYDVYTFLKEKTGVCQAYSLLYMELLHFHGIEARYMTSENMVHGWVTVKLNGKWYHVDVTWDDELSSDHYGLVNHGYFLLSDDAISRKSHYGWSNYGEKIVCSDNSFDGFFWSEVISPFVKKDGKWYYIGEHSHNVYGIYETELTSAGVLRKQLSHKWYSNGLSYYVGFFSGLGVYNNRLIYNTSDSVISLDTKTGEEEVLFKENESSQIFGIFVDEKITAVMSKRFPSEHRALKELSVIREGDMNADGRISAIDNTLLVRYISSKTEDEKKKIADYNGDGIMNGDDIKALRYYIVNRKELN